MKAHLVRLKDDRIDHAFPLAEAGTLAGRDAGCLIQVPNSQVSKRHARIHKEADCWFVEDLGSKNGTRVNGDPVQKAKIKDGDRIGFGPEEFLFTTRDINDPDFAPAHVIDLSSKTIRKTMDDSRSAGPRGKR